MNWIGEILIVIFGGYISFLLWDISKDFIIRNLKKLLSGILKRIKRTKSIFQKISQAHISGLFTLLFGIFVILLGTYFPLPQNIINFLNIEPYGVEEKCLPTVCFWEIQPTQTIIFLLSVKNNHLITLNAKYLADDNMEISYSCGSVRTQTLSKTINSPIIWTIFNEENVNEVCKPYLGDVKNSNFFINFVRDIRDTVINKKVAVSITPGKKLIILELVSSQKPIRKTMKYALITFGSLYSLTGLVTIFRGKEFKFFKFMKRKKK